MKLNIGLFIKQTGVNIICITVAMLISKNVRLGSLNYFNWIWLAIKIAGINLVTAILLNFVFYNKYSMNYLRKILRKMNKI